ncbi:MAG: DUF433 domain-containing protein [Gemmatimonadales bacterium]
MAPARSTTATRIDQREQPAYLLSEAARYLRLPAATLRSWVLGRQYATTQGPRPFRAVVNPAGRQPPTLSFWNLIECHVLRALRTDHGVPLYQVRQALTFAEKELGIERLLLRKELLTGAGRLFLDRYGELIDLSASGQIAMRQVLEAHLSRVEWDEWKFPVRLYPFMPAETSGGARLVAIDPAVAFGRPVLIGRGVTTAAIAERVDAGESVEDVAADYDLSPQEVEQAILYERAA